jgi:membrane-bound lytic murein transglycosylase C
MAAEKAAGYAVNPGALERDLERFQARLAALREAVRRVWGPERVEEPGPRRYVKYVQDWQSRVLVDFEAGTLRVESVVDAAGRGEEADARARLRQAVVTALLTPDDPRSLDLFSAGAVELGGTPFLLGEVTDHEGKDIRWEWRAGRFADHLLERRLERVPARDGQPALLAVQTPLVRDHLAVRAAKYRERVEAMAERYAVGRSLIYAVMRVESAFNPFAVSSAPAFGLMQVVPGTAGSDVNAFLGRPGAPSREQLFDPDANIEYGAAYLHLLQSRYLAPVADPLSREYCTIAAYNGGPGTVLRTFHQDTDRAYAAINALPPAKVYRTLRHDVPYDETRRYLEKVVTARKDFVNF